MRPVAANSETLLQLASRWPERYPVLLDSASSGPGAESSVLVAYPTGSLALRADRTLVTSDARIPRGQGFLDSLQAWWLQEGGAAGEGFSDLPWRGGFAVFLGYETAAEIEPTLRLPAAEDAWIAWALRTPAALAIDHRQGSCQIIAEPGAEDLVARIVADLSVLEQQPDPGGQAARGQWTHAPQVSEDPPQRYLELVERTKDLIRAGDVYQLNLSRAWRASMPADASAAQLYRRLRSVNPAPFAALAQWGGSSIVSASPERLVHVDRGHVSTRPIAGTRPRSGDQAHHASETSALIANAKERAEHVMLIDLERNDLGRICQAGTVVVDEFMTLESYPHVHHIVSNVSGQLRDGIGPVDVVRAIFPGGTITGCPKIRCMELIALLEGQGRGAYTGSIGTIGLDGSMDLNILIRTIMVRGDKLWLRTGAGIVADSVAERELEETRAKARGLLHAITGRA